MKSPQHNSDSMEGVSSIIVSEDEDEWSREFEDFKSIGAEIVDYGVSEDECEESSLASELPPKPSTQTSASMVNVSEIIKKTKCLRLKVIDCQKYPWYYAKHRKQILKEDNPLKLVISREVGINGSWCINEPLSKAETCSEVIKCEGDNAAKADLCKITPTIQVPLTNETMLNKANNTTEKIKIVKENSKEIQKRRGTKIKEIDLKHDKLTDSSPQNPVKIDIKKNIGLIGMRIQRMKDDDKPKEKSGLKTKTKISPQRRTKQKKINAKVKALGRNITLKPDSDKNQATKSIETNKDQQYSFIPKYPKNRLANKHLSLKCSLKIPSDKVLEVINKRELEISKKGNQTTLHDNITNEKGNSKYEKNIFCSKENKVKGLATDVSSITEQDKFENDYGDQIVQNNFKNILRRKPMPKSKRIEMDKPENERERSDSKKNKNTEKQQLENHKVSSNKIQPGLVKSIPIVYNDVNKNFELKSANNSVTKNDLCLTNVPFSNNEQGFTIDERNQSKPRNNTSTKQNIIENNNSLNVFTEASCEELNKLQPINSDNRGRVKLGNDNNVISDNGIFIKICNPDSVLKTKNIIEEMDKLTTQSNIFTGSDTDSTVNEHRVRIPNSIIDFSAMAKGDEIIDPIAGATFNQLSHSHKVLVPQQMESKKKQTIKIRSVNIENNMHVNILRKVNIHPKLTKEPSEPRQDLIHNMANIEQYGNIAKSKQSKILRPQQKLCKHTHDIFGTSGNFENYPQSSLNTNLKGHSNAKQLLHQSKKLLIPQHLFPIQTSVRDGKPKDCDNVGKDITPYSILSNNVTHDTTMPAIIIKPQENPNTNMKDVPISAGSVHLSHVNHPNSKATDPSTQMHPIMKVLDMPHHAVYLTNQGCHQRMPLNNWNFGGNNHLQNNFTIQPEYYTRNISQTIPDKITMPPDIGGANPLNIYWPENNIPPTTSLRTPPFYKNSSDSIDECSIIGRNKNGIVKKINISNPSTNSAIDRKGEIITAENFNDNATSPCLVTLSEKDTERPRPANSDKLVLPKIKMINMFEKNIPMNSSVKSELRRQYQFENSANPLTSVKRYKPGPQSKKLQFTNNVPVLLQNTEQAKPRQQYSAPILPIPTFETILSELQTPSNEILLIDTPLPMINNKNYAVRHSHKKKGKKYVSAR